MNGMTEWQERENQRMREHQPGEDSASRLWRQNERVRALLQSVVDAHDAGCVQFSSQDIQFDDEHPPHPWHEEWLADVRKALAVPNGDQGGAA